MVVVGAGIVGLACAAKLAAAGHEVLVIERHAQIGTETSSRNSGVIHAGLYYPEGSLKAQLCVRGRELLYARVAQHGLPHRKTGKLVVAATAEELPALEALATQAEKNAGVQVRVIDARELRALEPRVRAHAALWSPETGIVDAHALLHDYLREAREHGVLLSLHTTVTAVEPTASDDVCVVTHDTRGNTTRLHAGAVVNAAGLSAFELLQRTAATARALQLTPHFCKGDYFRLAERRRGLVSHLVYPMPQQAGLGVHLTLGLDGSLRAGPDTEYVDAPRFDVDERKRSAFGEALRRYVPEVRDEDLTPDFAGVRPKLHGPEARFHDFVIANGAADGLPRLVHLLGIESPGLTASEAIAERVAALLRG